MDTSGSISISLKGPTLQNLNAYVRPLIACVWYDLGLQLLDQKDRPKLDTIKANKLGDVEGACTEMFALWLKKNPSASWSLLIDTIKGPGVENYDAADKIERLVQQATTVATDLHMSTTDKSVSLNYSELFCHSKSVGAAYASLASNLSTILQKDNLPALKLALISQLSVPGVRIGEQLSEAIESANTSDKLLFTLQRSSCCNWLDTRLLEALACGSSQPVAYELVKAYKKFLHSKKLKKVLSWFSKAIQKPYACRIGAKFGINPNKITVGMLLKYRSDLEDVILNLGQGKVDIDHIKEGCLEIFCSIPLHCSFVAYANALHHRYKFQRISLLYLICGTYPVIYDPWLFDVEEQFTSRKEIFHEHEVATKLCNILLESAPVDDIIAVFSLHNLLMGDDLAVVTNAPSDYLKKMFLLRLFENVSLSVWSTICEVVNKSKILKHLSDQLVFEQKSVMQPQLECISMDTDNTDVIDEQPRVAHCLHSTKIISMDDSATATELYSPLILFQRRSSSFCHLHCLKHIKPTTAKMLFQYTVRHITELLSYCDPNLLLKWCQNLMASDTQQIKLFTANFIDKLKQLKTSRDILKLLSHSWNWCNFSILKVLAQFSKLAVDMLKEFDTRLNTMLPITEYPVASLAVSMFPYDISSYTVLTFECDQNLSYSLQLVFDMQSLITEYCDITQHALLLLAVDNDPTRLHWMIPKSVVTIVNTSVMQCSQLFFSKGVIRIFIYPSTVHVLDMALTVWPYMFSNENVKEGATKVLRPPNDQLRMLQHVRKQRDGWSTEAKQNKQFEENFRKDFEKEEQKYNKLKEQVTKEAQAVAKFKEKFASCKDNLESIIKVLAGDSANLPTVVEPTKEFTQTEGVQQLEQDLENLEQLTKHLLVKSIEQREEQFQQYEQKFQQKEKEIEDLKSEISAKDNKLDCYKKTEKELFSLSSKLKLQRDRLNVELEECNNKLKECQACLKSKDDDFSAACVKIEEMRHHISQSVEELAKKEEKIISHRSINEELTLKNLKLQQRIVKLQQEIEELESQHHKLQYDFYAENKRLKQQLEASNDDYITEKEFRYQIVMELNTLRKQAIERDTRLLQLHDRVNTERREKEQLEEYITGLNKHDESKHKCDRCGSMNRKVVKYTSDNFVCLAHDEYHFFCTDCYKRSCYCPVHSETKYTTML